MSAVTRPRHRPAEARDHVLVWVCCPREGIEAHRLTAPSTPCGLDSVQHGQIMPAADAIARHDCGWCRVCWGPDPYPYPEPRHVPAPPPEIAEESPL